MVDQDASVGDGLRRELLSELDCPICHRALASPRSCPDGHTFCRDCIVAWLGRSATCPCDRRPLALAQLSRCLPLEQLLRKMTMRDHSCPNALAPAHLHSPQNHPTSMFVTDN